MSPLKTQVSEINLTSVCGSAQFSATTVRNCHCNSEFTSGWISQEKAGSVCGRHKQLWGNFMTPHTKGSASPLYCMSWTETEAPADLPKGIECIYLLKWGVHVPKFRYIFLIWPPENTRIYSRNNIHNPHNMAFVKYRIKTWDSLPPTQGGHQERGTEQESSS